MELESIHLCGVMPSSSHLTGVIKMAKAKISAKQKKIEMKSLKAHVAFKSKELKNVELVVDTLLECIKNGDTESFRDVLTAHLMSVNKVQMAKKAGIGRTTLYDLMDPKKEFNPELSTISSILKAIAA